MNGGREADSGRIRLLAEPVDAALGGLLLRCLAEMTHLPTGIAGDQCAVIPLAPGGAADVVPAEAPALLHVTAGRVLVEGPGGEEAVVAGAGDTLVVPAGVPFRAFNPSESAPVQLLLVRGG